MMSTYNLYGRELSSFFCAIGIMHLHFNQDSLYCLFYRFSVVLTKVVSSDIYVSSVDMEVRMIS